MSERPGLRPRLGALLARFRPRLLTRIALALAAVGLAPLALATYHLIGVTEEAMTEQVLRTHAVAARTAAERVDAFLAVRRALAEGAAGSALLREPGSPAAQELLRRSLAAWSSLGVRAVAVYDERGQEVLRAGFADAGDKERIARGLAVPSAAPVLALPGSPLLLRIATPLGSGAVQETTPLGGAVMRIPTPLAAGGGAVRIVCDGSELTEVLGAEEIGEQAELVLADRNRRLLAGAAGALASYPPELLKNAFSGRLAGVQRRFRGPGGEPFLGAYAPVAQAPWAVLSRQPSKTAEAVARRMRRSAEASLAGALLLIGLIATAAYRTLVRPIRALADAQRRLGKADDRDRPADEIDDLRGSFALLEQRVRDRQALDRVFLGRYQVQEILGGGGMGTVFKGWDPRLQRTVALKTVRLAMTGREAREDWQDLQASLVREAVTIARLNHPNVVLVYDAEDTADGAFLAMEYVEGCTLGTLLAVQGQLAAGAVVPLGCELARGLAAAHARGIVHRDVKPANIMLGYDGAIKIADFGIAELLSAGAAPRRDRIFGTPGYVPPEALIGESFGTAGDLFSLGAVLYEALTGMPPFGAGATEQVLYRTLLAGLKPPRVEVPDLPPELDELILRLLDRRPEQRPKEAAAVAAALQRLALAHGWSWSPPAALDGAPPARRWRPAEGQWIATRRLSE